jgi:hypothetical protein
MADFLEDYSGLAAAGSAFNGFADAYARAQDREMKRMETAAQIEATRQKIQREKDQSDIDMVKQHMTRNKETGAMEQTAMTPRDQAVMDLDAGKAGYKAASRDELGYPTKFEYDPNSVKAHEIEASKVRYQTANEYKKAGVDLRNDRMDRSEHEKVLGRINSDPQVKQKLSQFSGISNAFSIINEADTLTPEQIKEFQQTIRSNLGMKGAGGVGEREETYFKSLGLNAARMREFLTGDPVSISKDSKLVAHFKQLAGIEQNNVRAQYDRAIKAAASGHASMYGRRPDLYEDLRDSIEQHQGQLAPIESAAPAAAPPGPQGGLVKPQGFLSRLGGLLMGSQADAGQSPAPHPQDSQAIQWARANPKDPRAIEILRQNGG